MSSEVKRQHAQERTKQTKQTDEDLARNLLIESADYLADGHWISGDLKDGRGNFCALGVLQYTSRKNRIPDKIRRIAEKMLAQTIAPVKGSKEPEAVIVTFNDMHRRRSSTVISKFRKAAEKTD